jgi:EAL domain-containing protein (putative c-di-GMP-specific phosphodiesterase class I)
MYRAKELGRNRILFYEADMQADVQERLALEQDLKKASAEGQLAAFVQSQVDASGTVIGGELLMRWNHPVRGNVPPSRFIPVAESAGLILRMGDWMILQACETRARLHAAGQDLSSSVNVSARQFRQDDFVERVRGMLAQTGAPAVQLILEVTESLLIENLDGTIARMTELGRRGVRFSIDDFGTVYSSLAYLKRLPLYEMIIDKSFVQDTPDDPSDTAIVQSIISVARHLKLRVVAEGVETRAQADFLVTSQCDCLQGYLFSRPEPLQGWLARQLGEG